MYSSEYHRWIERAMGWLMAWGIGSVIAGAGLATRGNAELRHAGLQALSWGAIDAALALNARIGARRKQAQPPSEQATRDEARRTHAIVVVNGALDVGYIVAGTLLARNAGRRLDRRGMGIGIAVQGTFLLVYDALLALGLGRWTQDRSANERE